MTSSVLPWISWRTLQRPNWSEETAVAGRLQRDQLIGDHMGLYEICNQYPESELCITEINRITLDRKHTRAHAHTHKRARMHLRAHTRTQIYPEEQKETSIANWGVYPVFAAHLFLTLTFCFAQWQCLPLPSRVPRDIQDPRAHR